MPIHNVANGTAALDAVNKSQLDAMYEAASSEAQAARDDALRGVAISNAMEVFLPDPGKKFRVNMGVGYCLIVRPTFADAIERKLAKMGETVFRLGTIEKGSGTVQLT